MNLILLICTLVGGILQGLTGFGSGIVMMQFYPTYMSVVRASAITAAISFILNLIMAFDGRKLLKLTKVILPMVVYAISSSLAVNFATGLDERFMSLLLGGFFIFLAIYLFIKNDDKKLKMPAKIALMVLCGVFSGLFGVGGPFMVYYFLDCTDSAEEYLATSNAFFLLQNLYITSYRVVKGIIVAADVPIIIIGMIVISIGTFIARSFRSKIDEATLRKFIYVFIGVSGLITVLKNI